MERRHNELEEVEEEQEVKDNMNSSVREESSRKRRRKEPTTRTSEVTREVRAVHGKSTSGGKELWLYVPADGKKSVSMKKRDGWWLYPEKGKTGHYYIGPKDAIQTHQKSGNVKDEAVFPNFPFVHTVQLDNHGKTVPKTERCVTLRALTADEFKQACNGTKLAEPSVAGDSDEDHEVDEADADDEDCFGSSESDSDSNTDKTSSDVAAVVTKKKPRKTAGAAVGLRQSARNK